MAPSPQQTLALIKETETSIMLIKHGLGHLQQISLSNDFFHLPMLLLANGFERLLKVIICLHTLEQTGNFPTKDELKYSKKGTGHNLVSMLDKVTGNCFGADYLRRPVAQADLSFLKHDAHVHEIISILSDFGQGGRYHDLDTVVGNSPNSDSPNDRWGSLELNLFKSKFQDQSDFVSSLTSAESARKGCQEVVTHLVVYFEKMARALTRLFTLGSLGSQARSLTGIISIFLTMQDTELGTRNYIGCL